MDDLRMYSQEEVAQILHVHISTVAMLREIGVMKAIKTGRNYMFSRRSILKFQDEYEGMDVSNMYKALQSKEIVDARASTEERRNYYGNS